MSFLKRRPKLQSKERVVCNPVTMRIRQGETASVTPSSSCPSHTQQSSAFDPIITRTSTEMLDVTAVIVNFKTLALTQQAYNSLLQFYAMPIIVVDNGSQSPPTTEWVQQIGGMCYSENIGHGPAMDAAIKQIKTRYVLTLDSDCVVLRGGWLEQMIGRFATQKMYAVGWLRYVDRWSGVPVEWHLQRPPQERFVGYIHPAVGLYDVEKYNGLRPFIHHGAPALWNMLDAENAGYDLCDFPVFDYVKHLVAGTRRMFDGRWDPTTNEKAKEWNEKGVFPI